MDIVVGAGVAGLLLVLWIASATQQVTRANQKVKVEVEAAGKVYDPSRAGRPLRDGCLLIVLALLFAAGAMSLLGTIFPLP